MTYQAVLFDLDGTLLDTLEDLADSMNAVLRHHGLPEHPVEAYKQFVGTGVEELVRQALPEGRRDAVTRAACALQMRQEYARRWDRKTRPYPGIPELLDALAARRVKTAVLSNKVDQYTKLTVKKLLPGRCFDVVVGERPGVPLKPDPTAALAIARQLQVPPAQFVYLGDSGTDMRTARAAGMFAVGALWGFRSAEELRANGAQVLIEQPLQLLDFFPGSRQHP